MEKICTQCGRSLPLTEENWYKRKRAKDGFMTQCRECHKSNMREQGAKNKDELNRRRRERYRANHDEIREQRREYRRQNRDRINAQLRQSYHRHRERNLAKMRERYQQNRDERKAQNRAHYLANREHILAHQRTDEFRKRERELSSARRRANPDKHRLYMIEWRANNREKARAVSRRAYRNNPEYHKGYQKRYRRENPHKIAVHHSRRRARFVSAEGSFSGSDITSLFETQGGKCAYCGTSIKNGYHVDHIVPLSRGGSNWPENLCLACPPCNLAKNDKTPEEWLAQKEHHEQLPG